jgi:membrane-associated protease RseP (regulator of RpoE activity)
MVALVFGAGAVAQAQNDEKSDGNIVKIGRADEDQAKPNLPPPGEELGAPGIPQQPPMPKYWIGLLGGTITADSPLRAHLELPENQGLIVANIVPDSPAAKAGLKQHDILLRANDKELHEMSDLVDLVLSEGPKKGQITLEVMRHNKRETVYLTPEERPANAPMPQPQGGGFGMIGGGDDFGDVFGQFGSRLPMEFRNFGPGVIVGGGGQGFAGMPNGVQISVQKQDGEAPHITVKRGEETWNVTGDDPKSLKQLPEDLRPFVEQMLHNDGMKIHMPNFDRGPGAPGVDNGPLRERLERMEQQMEELQKRLLGNDQAPADQPNDQPAETK